MLSFLSSFLSALGIKLMQVNAYTVALDALALETLKEFIKDS